jgi:UDPglucose 6-dehydrogenase
MNVAVIGAGYVGLVTAAGLAHGGHRVTCIDIDHARIEALRFGKIPFYEPGLERVVTAELASGRLRFEEELGPACDARVAMIAVGTPPAADGSADLTAVFRVARQLAPLLADRCVVAMKSTVPVGTTYRVAELMRAAAPDAHLGFASNPEFLREGQALEDFFRPDRVVIGCSHPQAEQTMRELYQDLVSRERVLVMDVCSAELTKHAANAMLATRISFMNELSLLAERAGADIEQVRAGIGSDGRIGPQFLRAGAGFGGSCFPKDLLALVDAGRVHDAPMSVVRAAWEANQRQKHVIEQKLERLLGRVAGKRIALWGLAFKPNTDDIRDAPALEVAQRLVAAGAALTVYDPVAMPNARKQLGELVTYAQDPYACARGSDALVLMTEWPELSSPDFGALRSLMSGDVLIDGRNVWSAAAAARSGFWYASIGRNTAEPLAKVAHSAA